MVYSYTSSESYFIIFRLNKCLLQFKRLSNNMNVVFYKPVPMCKVYALLSHNLLKVTTYRSGFAKRQIDGSRGL